MIGQWNVNQKCPSKWMWLCNTDTHLLDNIMFQVWADER